MTPNDILGEMFILDYFISQIRIKNGKIQRLFEKVNRISRFCYFTGPNTIAYIIHQSALIKDDTGLIWIAFKDQSIIQLLGLTCTLCRLRSRMIRAGLYVDKSCSQKDKQNTYDPEGYFFEFFHWIFLFKMFFFLF